ncbi:NAD-dependent isocitrate dehydrogenase, partial [Naganishia albida]
DAIKSINKQTVALEDPLATSIRKDHVRLNLTLRRTFSLYPNVRNRVSIQGYKTAYENVNTVLIRENTEDEYSDNEHEMRLENSRFRDEKAKYSEFRSSTVSTSRS